MSNLVRAITADGSAVAIALNSTEIVGEIEKIHKTSAVVTAALGRLATGASLMGYMLKNEQDSITLRIKADGPAVSLIAVANSHGNVKAYVQNPVVEIPLNSKGKLDVAGAVGTDGFLSVIKDIGLKEPYSGQVPLVSGEIAEDITSYYAISEQIPTVCALGVLVNPDLTVKSAGGFLIQLLPFADESCIDIIEKNIKELPPISELFDSGLTPKDVCMRVLQGLEPNVLDETNVAYKCDCSRERVSRALISLGKEELQDMIDGPDETEVTCHFCNKAYHFSKDELRGLLSQKK